MSARRKAIARLREAVRVFDLDSIDHDPIVSFDDLRAILAHIDGEPARLAAKAEEVREACAIAVGAGDPEDHDHSKTGRVGCHWCAQAAAVRATPLDARPLADRIAELEAQKVDLKTMIQDLRGRAEKAERLADQLCAVLGREVGNRGDSEGAVDVAERIIRERDEAVAALRALLREEWYIYEGNLEASGRAAVDDLNAARAVLAKYPEER